MKIRWNLLICTCILSAAISLQAQGFLHTDGSRIVDGSGENFIIRSIGTGNWMIQEGYMMKSSGIAGTQHAFREKLIETIGVARTDSFYSAWLASHMTRTDIDSMAAWGFNAVRPALHYKWFTLPIEDEPVTGEQTWLETGFVLLDSLVQWCADNQMYVILDMHGTPGGQGKNADISDYDPDKPALWESEHNKTKLVALWRKLAERYAGETWIGGYDLINETNWEFPEGNNSQLKAIYQRITDTIRQVDTNHILFIEGNWFANDFSGLTPPWDANMVYSFHKYWSENGPNSLDYATWLRDNYNVPLWLGETGENSNTWFTNLVTLAENRNIGWSFWPVKKGEVSNLLRVDFNEDYLQLIDSWRGQAPEPDTAEAFQAVLKLAENHRFENCHIQYDVIDAMIRQPFSNETLPFRKAYEPGDTIFAADYDLGRNNHAYYDIDTADYHGDTGEYTSWNSGFSYRNDGVDIQECNDPAGTNGYNVGWTNEGEWLVYTMKTDSSVLVDGVIRSAGAGGEASVVFEAGGEIISENILLSPTGGWQSWRSTTFSNVLLPAGEIKLKLSITEGGANLNYFRFTNHRSANEQEFAALYCETSIYGNDLYLHLNKDHTGETLSAGDFTLINGSVEVPLLAAAYEEGSQRIIRLTPGEVLLPSADLSLKYSGNTIRSGDETMGTFQDMPVANLFAFFPTLPARIEAEDFTVNNGFELEECLDANGGYNTGYADYGDYLDYLVYVPQEQKYQLSLRTALNGGNATIRFYNNREGDFEPMNSLTLTNTGGWQVWEVQNTELTLPTGKYMFRIRAVGGAFNLNWLRFSPILSVESDGLGEGLTIFPNPAGETLFIETRDQQMQNGNLVVINSNGKPVFRKSFNGPTTSLELEGVSPGLYLLVVRGNGKVVSKKFIRR